MAADYLLSLELVAGTRGLTVGLNAGTQQIRQFGRNASDSFRGVGDVSRAVARQAKDDWTKAARDVSAAQASFAKDATSANRKAMQEAEQKLRQVTQVRQQAMQDISRGLLLTSAAFTLGILATVNVTRNFEKELSVLAGAADAAGLEMKQLEQAVLDAGQASVFSASEAARGAQELSKAGVSISNIVGGGLKGALDLAAAGQLGLAEAAEIGATALNVFGLSGTQMAHVADLLAAGAGKAQGSVHDMGFALRQSALVANQFGLSLEETVGGLTLFAKNGLVGSDAGTSFRTMLLRLNPMSAEAGAAMRQLSLDFYDAEGNFVGITNVAGQLQRALGNASDETRDMALNTIFGQDAIRGANILIAEGAEGYQAYIDKVNDFGFANRLAAKNMDNLNGDLERLKGSLEVAIIGTGQQADSVLRDLVQTAELMVSAYADLPDSIQGSVLALAGFVAVGTGAVGIAGTMIPKYQALNDVFLTMGTTGKNLSTALRFATIGLGAASAAAAAGLLIYGIYAQEKAKAKAITDSFTEALRAEADGQTGASSAAIGAEIHKRKLNDTMKELGVSQADYIASLKGDADATARVTDAILRQTPALANNSRNYVLLRDSIQGNRRAFNDLVNENLNVFDSTNEQGKAIRRLIGAHNDLDPKVRKAIKDAADEEAAKKDARDASLELGRSYGLSGGQLEQFTQTASGQKDELGDLAASLNFTREELVKLAGGSEETAEAIGKTLQGAIDKTSQSFASFGDILGEFGGKESVAAGDLRKFYKDAITESNKFLTDINAATQRGLDPQLTARLLQAGPEQAGPVLKALLSDHSGRMIQMANESEAALQKVNERAVAFARLTTLAVNDQTDQLVKDLPAAMKIVAAAYENGGQISAQKLNEKLGIGLEDAKRITDAYGLSIVTGFNNVRDAFGNAPINVAFADDLRQQDSYARTGRAYAQGGIENHAAQIARGQTPYRVWAEPETGGEAYIPLASSKRGRSTEILQTVAYHFGLDVIDPRNGGNARSFAGGGILGVYPPPSPGGAAVPGGMYAGMNHGYKLLEAFYKKMQSIGGGWESITSFLQQAGVPFTVTSTTGGQHAAGSYHYAGKAADLVGPDMFAIFRALERAAGSLSELFFDPMGYSYKRGQRINPIGGHSDHVHAATYDKGGYINPGWTMVHNNSGRPEPVFSAAQWDQMKTMFESGGIGAVNNYISGDSKSVAQVARETTRKTIRARR
jgi:TP901 family phage tail tape measure protein